MSQAIFIYNSAVSRSTAMFQATFIYNCAVSRPIAFILPRCCKPLLSIILRCPGQLRLYCRDAPSHFFPKALAARVLFSLLPSSPMPSSPIPSYFPLIFSLLGAPALIATMSGIAMPPSQCLFNAALKVPQATFIYNSAVSRSIAFILPRCPKPLLSIILRCPGQPRCSKPPLSIILRCPSQLPLYCRDVPSHFYL